MFSLVHRLYPLHIKEERVYFFSTYSYSYYNDTNPPSHRRSVRNLKQNSEKLKIPFPLVSRKRKKKKKKSEQLSLQTFRKSLQKGSRPKSLAIEQKFTPPATIAIDFEATINIHPSKIFYLPWSTRTYELLVTTRSPPFPLEIRFDRPIPTTSRRLIPIPSTITLEIDASRTTIRFRSGRNSGALPNLDTIPCIIAWTWAGS